MTDQPLTPAELAEIREQRRSLNLRDRADLKRERDAKREARRARKKAKK